MLFVIILYSKSGISSDKIMHFRGSFILMDFEPQSDQLASLSETLAIARRNFESVRGLL